MYIDRNTLAYFDSFGIEYIPQEVLSKHKDKSTTYNMFRIQLKLNTIEVLISKASIDWYISHEDFVSVNKLLREYNKMKKEVKTSEISVEYTK